MIEERLEESLDTELNQANQKRNVTVSIGMPVYNGANYLRNALDTLLEQSFTDFELIISDNASSDSTESICRQYAENDARIRYIRQETNIGAVANFKFVLNKAAGSYFMWAASDDMWSLDWLEKLHEAIREEGVGMAFGQVVHIDTAGQVMKHPANGVSFGYGYSDSSLVRRARFYLAYEGMGKANSIYSLYKRSLIEPLDNLWQEVLTGSCTHDYTIVYSCLQHERLKQVGQATLFKRIHSASEGTKPDEDTKFLVRVVKKVIRLLWPFPPKLFRDYLHHSTVSENIVLLLLFPLKLFGAYLFRLKQIISKLRLH